MSIVVDIVRTERGLQFSFTIPNDLFSAPVPTESCLMWGGAPLAWGGQPLMWGSA